MAFKKGYTPWNVGKGSAPQIGTALKGKKMPWVSRLNSELTGDKARRWKGDLVGYVPLHRWVAKQLGTPSHCQHCDTTTDRRYEWANVSGDYKRETSDWIRLCKPCHVKYDKGRGAWGALSRRLEDGWV